MNVESTMREKWEPHMNEYAGADTGVGATGCLVVSSNDRVDAPLGDHVDASVGDRSDTRTEGPAESGRIIAAISRTRAQLAAWGHICLDDGGQGTTEYAILVGVLVVIAIVAVTAFRGKLTELWSAITDGINGL